MRKFRFMLYHFQKEHQLRFRSRYSVKTIIIAGLCLILVQAIVHFAFDLSGNGYDYKATDMLYSFANKNGHTPPVSNRVVFLTINDNTYDYLKSNLLDRKFLARGIDDLASFSPEAVMFDILFARPSSPKADSIFAESVRNAGNICLPAGFSVSFENRGGLDREGVYFERMKKEFLIHPKESGIGKPYIAGRGLYQADPFAEAAGSFGHITTVSEADGVYRLYPMLIKIDSGYIPTATLSMFCKIYEINTNDIEVKWGESITIPAGKESKLEKDIIIPIDEHGRTFIPFAVKWQEDKRKMEIRNFIERAENPELTDELTEFFEGNVVFVGDVSTGISDVGSTPIDDNAPLVLIHAAIMNAFFTDSFYSFFPTNILFLIVIGISILLTFLATLKNGMVFNVFSWVVLFLVILFAYIQLMDGSIFPVVTMQANIFVCYLVLLVIIQYTSSKEQSFIKSAFSRYLSPTVVDRLIENREGLTLGGEERELTIFFSDIAGFTTISEKTNPQQLVKLLNEYFTEMTTIITNNGGMIDKYIGDAIMAEFGAPLYFEGHSLAATRAALQMQKKCDDLNKIWKQRGDPEIRARIGLNSGNVILGNMGSHQVFDYTVIGDSVNLASRLESAGKKYGCNILISESVYTGIVGSGIQTRLLDYIKVKGKTKPVKVFEVMDDEYYEKYREYFLRFQEALDEYYNRNFTKAGELFSICTDLKPGDPASIEFIKRIKYFDENPPEADWDGSFEMRDK